MDYLKAIYETLSNNQIQFWTLIATISSTILWGVYVYFTIKTFNQIKKQTDLQSRAFLLITPRLCQIDSKPELDSIATNLSNKWRRILENNLSEAISENKIFEIELTNRGKSDVINWSIEIIANIKEGSYLHKKFSVNGEETKWSIASKPEQTIAPNQAIRVPVILVGDFPQITLFWKISYTDLMEGKYEIENKISGYSSSNVLAFNYKE